MSAPPLDSRAEDALLSLAYIFPEYVGRLDLSQHLHCMEHQHIWRAMVHVHMRTPGLEVGPFWLALRDELHDQVCARAEQHAPERYACWGWRYLQVLSCESANPKDIGYWMGRLRRVTEARLGIAAAQEMAARYWRLDIRGARHAAATAMQRATQPEMEIPV